MKVTERLIARHALTNAVGDRLLNAKATQREEAQGVAASFRDIAWLEEKIHKFKWIDCENDQNHRVIAPFHDERTNVYSISYSESLTFFKNFRVACKRRSSVNSGARLRRFDDATGVEKNCVAKSKKGKKWRKNVSLQLNIRFPQTWNAWKFAMFKNFIHSQLLKPISCPPTVVKLR